MPPETSPPLSPQQLLAQRRWPAAPHQLPARLAPTHQDAGSPALLSLLPPAPSAPCQLWAWGGGGPPLSLGASQAGPVPRSDR